MVSEEEVQLRDEVWADVFGALLTMYPRLCAEEEIPEAFARVLGMGISLGVLYGETDATMQPEQRRKEAMDKLHVRMLLENGG